MEVNAIGRSQVHTEALAMGTIKASFKLSLLISRQTEHATLNKIGCR